MMLWRTAPAQSEAEQALRLAPNDQEVLNVVATVAVARGQYEEALRYGQRSVELDPNNGGVH